MKRNILLKMLLVAGTLALAGGVQAALLDLTLDAGGQTFVEGDVSTIVASGPGVASPISFYSDTEDHTDPWHLGYDSSDGIDFGNLPFVPVDLGGAGFWQPASGNQWVLPAVTPAGTENEPAYEPIGRWFLPGARWTNPGQIVLTESPTDPTWSDTINFYNGANGAYVSFDSDPAAVPEPTTMIAGALLLLPFGVQGIRRFRNRK